MVRIGRVISTACGADGRVALAFVVVGLIAGATLGPREPNTPPRPESGDLAGSTNAVILRVPEGGTASHLTLLDESGREVAVLSRWRDGALSLAAHRGGGRGLGYHLKIDDTTRLDLFVAVRMTTVLARPDGSVTTRTEASSPSRPAPSPDTSTPNRAHLSTRPDGGSGGRVTALSHP